MNYVKTFRYLALLLVLVGALVAGFLTRWLSIQSELSLTLVGAGAILGLLVAYLIVVQAQTKEMATRIGFLEALIRLMSDRNN